MKDEQSRAFLHPSSFRLHPFEGRPSGRGDISWRQHLRVTPVALVSSVAWAGPSGGIVTTQPGPRTTIAASFSSCVRPPASRSFSPADEALVGQRDQADLVETGEDASQPVAVVGVHGFGCTSLWPGRVADFVQAPAPGPVAAKVSRQGRRNRPRPRRECPGARRRNRGKTVRPTARVGSVGLTLPGARRRRPARRAECPGSRARPAAGLGGRTLGHGAHLDVAGCWARPSVPYGGGVWAGQVRGKMSANERR